MKTNMIIYRSVLLRMKTFFQIKFVEKIKTNFCAQKHIFTPFMR